MHRGGDGWEKVSLPARHGPHLDVGLVYILRSLLAIWVSGYAFGSVTGTGTGAGAGTRF